MAIEEVEFRKNSSILFDEIIAHRLALIPLKTDLKSYFLPELCKCEGKGCARCQLKITLKAKGPSVVYASDLKSKDPEVKPIHPNMPIVKLLKGQELELEATAVLGKGKAHVKWSPGLVWYKYKPSIEIGDAKNPGAVVEACPVSIFELKSGKLAINKDNMMKCHLCGACVEADPSIKLNCSNKDFIFYLESWGQLEPKKILLEAAKIFEETLDELAALMKKQ